MKLARSAYFVVPKHLHRVKFGGVSGQPFHLKPVWVCTLQQPHRLAMGTETIGNQDELAPQMPVEHPQKVVLRPDATTPWTALRCRSHDYNR